MRRLNTIVIILIAAAVALSLPALPDYQIDWFSINCGGGLASGGDYALNGSVGQSCAGFTFNTSNLHWIGFWAGDLPAPTVVDTVGGAKLLPDGALVSLAGKVATSAEADFSGFFYVEDENRASGIRVATPPAAMAGLLRGHKVNVIGTLGTTASGERQIAVSFVIVVGSRDPLIPLGMPNLSVGGADYGEPPLGQYGVSGGFGTNNVGLLITTWGRVIEEAQGWVVIDDGSGTPLRVDTTTVQDEPEEGEYVAVVGISSLYKPSGYRLRLVLPRDDGDVN